jgi:hypothetical protein
MFGDNPDKISCVEGNVTLNSLTPLSGVTIGVDSTTRDIHLQRTTNSAGYFLFEQIRPGPYTIWADAKGYGCILIPRLIVPRGERVRQDFNFIRGGLYGACEPLKSTKPK